MVCYLKDLHFILSVCFYNHLIHRRRNTTYLIIQVWLLLMLLHLEYDSRSRALFEGICIGLIRSQLQWSSDVMVEGGNSFRVPM